MFMCGIGGVINLKMEAIPNLAVSLNAINELQRHRGPDGQGVWVHSKEFVGFAHRRLQIIDLFMGSQPMCDDYGNWVTFNGEIYNYIELRNQLGLDNFRTTSDTEVILHAYRRWGDSFADHLYGMFAFALWDESQNKLICARDRFGIKPFYFLKRKECLYFASEMKALLPFVKEIETDLESLMEYLTFQFCLQGKTLFKDIQELLPGNILEVKNGSMITRRYWDVYFELDPSHTEKYFEEQLRSLLKESVRLHMRSDVPVGAYISGGLDSGAVASLASMNDANGKLLGFTGKFEGFGALYDESFYANLVAKDRSIDLYQIEITANDFVENIRKIIYHLDCPVAGPGSFPQYMVSSLAARHRKVVLGGQGGDEIFGGYVRYLIAYFEQCIKGAIEGTMSSGNFLVTYESIIPNLVNLRNYKPLLQSFWQEGLFESMDKRYFRLVNRAPDLGEEVNWVLLGDYNPFETFRKIFYRDNVGKESYFDLMTNFDFRTLLPALLQVEDRMSMAHGLESRVPLLDHQLVELAATIPADIKFKSGSLKHIFRKVIQPFIPSAVLNRTDKMGFTTPLTEIITGDAREFVCDVLSTQKARQRDIIDNEKVLDKLDSEGKFGRNIWGLLCLELWLQEFHDNEPHFKNMLKKGEIAHER
jgi:asparagine synthase (glutamine-hydrolysing)